MKIALVQLNPLIADFKRQFEGISRPATRQAAGCDLAVFRNWPCAVIHPGISWKQGFRRGQPELP